MSTSEEDAPDVIAKLIHEQEGSGTVASLIEPTSQLHISSSENVQLKGFDTVVSCTLEPFATSALKDAGVKQYLHLKCQTGKLGSRDLRTQLPRLLPFFSSLPIPEIPGKILVCCPTGKDLSVGVALAILCLYTDEGGAINTGNAKEAKEMGKSFIKQRLSWITTSNAALNPSRATLQSVNAMLLSSQDPKATLHTRSADTSNSTAEKLPLRQTRPLASEPENTASQDPTPPPQTSMPATIFANLHTATQNATWKFTRELSSKLPTHPSGQVTGTATFTPCVSNPSSSSSSSSQQPPPTLLYSEQGTFTTSTGLQFTARRKYVYQLSPSTPTDGEFLTVRFFDDEKMREGGEESGVGGARSRGWRVIC